MYQRNLSSKLGEDFHSEPMSPTTESPLFLPWDNPQNIISHQTRLAVTSVCDLFLYPPISFIGAATNLINCLVFYRQGLRERMTLCLFFLSMVDCLFLLSLFCMTCSAFVKLMDVEAGAEYEAKVMVYFAGVELGLKTTSSCISALISVERCVCVVNPLKAAGLIATRTMGVLLVVIVVSCQLLHVFFPLKFDVKSMWDDQTNVTIWSMVPSKRFLKNEEAFQIVDDIILSSAVPLTTFIVVSMTTAVTVVKLKAALTWRETSANTQCGGHRPGNQKQSEAALTRMLVLLSCVYIVFSAPLVAVALTRFSVEEFESGGAYHNVFWASHYVATLFGSVSSAVNFFVFVCQSTRFRHELRALFGPCCGVLKNDDKERATTAMSVTA